MRVEVIQRRKRYDYERVRCAESGVPGSVSMNRRSTLLCLPFLFVSTGVCERRRGICLGEYGYVSRPLERIGRLRYDFCILLSLPLVS